MIGQGISRGLDMGESNFSLFGKIDKTNFSSLVCDSLIFEEEVKNAVLKKKAYNQNLGKKQDNSTYKNQAVIFVDDE